MEDNFALRYVFTYPGIIHHAELVPSHGASRRRLGDNNNGSQHMIFTYFKEEIFHFTEALFISIKPVIRK
jgi:hypothetical protein